MTTNSNNQALYKKRAELYGVQNELARTTNEDERKRLLARQQKLDKELKALVEKNNPVRQYCTDNKCSDMKNLTNTNMNTKPNHVKHLP